jgi:hypothetical protein
MGKPMSSKSNSKSQTQTQEIPSEVEFLKKYRCTEERKPKERDYTVYNCTAVAVTKDNIREVIEEMLNVATQFNAVVRLFGVIEEDSSHTISLTATRGGYVGFEVRFPQRIAGFQNVLSVRIQEVKTLKALADKLAELAQNLTL